MGVVTVVLPPISVQRTVRTGWDWKLGPGQASVEGFEHSQTEPITHRRRSEEFLLRHRFVPPRDGGIARCSRPVQFLCSVRKKGLDQEGDQVSDEDGDPVGGDPVE